MTWLMSYRLVPVSFGLFLLVTLACGAGADGLVYYSNETEIRRLVPE